MQRLSRFFRCNCRPGQIVACGDPTASDFQPNRSVSLAILDHRHSTLAAGLIRRRLFYFGGNRRFFSSEGNERESMEYDVVIVGAGPAGLSAAIRLKQLCREQGSDLSVCVLEKGAEVGAHILSGNVFETRALDELLPEWRQEGAPIEVPVSRDKFYFLTRNSAVPLPSPFKNNGNFVISLSQLSRWMASKAEDLGVEIYPGFAADEVLYDSNQKVIGIRTNDMGISKNGSKRETFQQGVDLKGRMILLAEGCRGSLSEKIIRKFNLREKSNAEHQTYALGIKEVWEIEDSKHEPGYVLHTIGWPLDVSTYGGSFLYHMKDRMVSIGLVVALDFRNPYLSPYDEFQVHPIAITDKMRELLGKNIGAEEGEERVCCSELDDLI